MTHKMTHKEILETAYSEVSGRAGTDYITDPELLHDIKSICECNNNKALVRLLLTCSVAKIKDDSKEPEQTVSHDLKMTFLHLRKQLESTQS